MKSVRQNKYATDYVVSSEIEFNLMFKSKTKYSTIILPYSLKEQFQFDEEQTTNEAITFDLFNAPEYASCAQYFKILSKSDEQIDEICQRERGELIKQLATEKNEPEVCFVNEALLLLDERENALKSEMTQKKMPLKKIKPAIMDAFNDLTLELKEEATPPVKAAANSDYVYFYQSTDGQRIYLNPLNARMMLSEYESFANCPQLLCSKVIATESFFMTEENRRRFKYLSHLPLHSEFKIVELDLKEPFVSKKTIELFREEIEEKKRLRARKQLREKRFADRTDPNIIDPHYYNASAMSEQMFATTPTVKPDYTNEFPEASTSPSTSSSGISSGHSSVAMDKGNQQQQQQISFAQMIRHTEAVPITNRSTQSYAGSLAPSVGVAWPSLDDQTGPRQNMSQQSSQLTNGWLNLVKQGPTLGRSKKIQEAPSPWTKNTQQLNEADLDELENEEAMPAPLYKQSFFSAIDETLKIIDTSKKNTC